MIGLVVRKPCSRKEAPQFIKDWSTENLSDDEFEQFVDLVENEILALHEGNFARYKIRPSEFEAWQKVWNIELH